MGEPFSTGFGALILMKEGEIAMMKLRSYFEDAEIQHRRRVETCEREMVGVRRFDASSSL